MADAELLKHVCSVDTYAAGDCCDLLLAVRSYLSGFRWANLTGRMWVGECIPGVIGIFLVELELRAADIDSFIWVIVGDLPPAYLSPVHAKSPREALHGYIGEMSAWVEAVEGSGAIDELIPMDAAPTIENASSAE